MIRLHHYELSAECYKVRLLLSMLGLAHETVQVDMYPGAAHLSDSHRRLSPLGRLPVVEDGDLILDDANAILVHLAASHDPGGTWFARAPGQIAQWLGYGAALAASLGAARLMDCFDTGMDSAPLIARALPILDALDRHLWLQAAEGHFYLCGTGPSIADIACFADTVLAEEAGVALRRYPAVRRWHDRVRMIPGFIVMPGVFPR